MPRTIENGRHYAFSSRRMARRSEGKGWATVRPLGNWRVNVFGALLVMAPSADKKK
jgi:hypothetical protein